MDRVPGMSIRELAERCGLTPRTIRYYTAEGLLPPGGGSGQRRVYGHGHFVRLMLIKRLKEDYLPLSIIRREISGLSLNEMEQVVEKAPTSPRGATQAYLHAAIESVRADNESDSTEGFTPSTEERHTDTNPARSGAMDAPWQRLRLASGIELHFQLNGKADQGAMVQEIVADAMLRISKHASRKPGQTRG